MYSYAIYYIRKANFGAGIFLEKVACIADNKSYIPECIKVYINNYRIFSTVDFLLMTFKELISKHQGEYISYAQYLTTKEWLDKREEIVERDNHTCTNCKKGTTFSISNWGAPIKYHLLNINSSTGENAPWHIKGDSKLILADKHYHLEVHHMKYIFNRLPWDYTKDDLITLCNHCHTDFHNNNKVPVYSENELMELDYEICSKCNGTGYISQYDHVENGVCFQCMGEKYTKPLIGYMS